jgi:membrane protein DedA with SNARE-associated domain
VIDLPFASTTTDLIVSGGYLAIFALIVAETVFPPIPSEIILPFAGFLVARDELQLVPVLVAATLGSVAGALLLYWLSRTRGRAWLLRYGRKVGVDAARLKRVEDRFARRSKLIVFGGRLVPGLRSLVSIPAGLANMPLRSFVTLTAIGSALWNFLLVAAGERLGAQFGRVEGVIEPVSAAVVAIVVVSITWSVWRARRKLKREEAS